jgi:16S rRNA (cytosine967-C5)-methyltransferase
LNGARLTDFSPDGIILESAAVSELECLKDGRVTVQDEASQICIRALDAKEDDLVLDVCACPGSKSFGAAMTMQNKGKILAFDIHENKLSLIKTGAERLGIDIIETQAHDARKPIEELIGKADKIICDVPCSGLGVASKKPDVRRKNAEDVEGLAESAYEILNASVSYLRAGGRLVYSTCTLRRAENEDVVEKFLREHTEFGLADDKYLPGGMRTFLPHRDGCDGFFGAKLIRKTNN